LAQHAGEFMARSFPLNIGFPQCANALIRASLLSCFGLRLGGLKSKTQAKSVEHAEASRQREAVEQSQAAKQLNPANRPSRSSRRFKNLKPPGGGWKFRRSKSNKKAQACRCLIGMRR
jgi:hypothetical protein